MTNKVTNCLTLPSVKSVFIVAMLGIFLALIIENRNTWPCNICTQVILESLRMASIISFTFREAVADVAYKGKIFGSKHIYN